MAGMMRLKSADRALDEQLRSLSGSSLGESSSADNGSDEAGDTVEEETDIDDFRRWLEEQPRGSAAPSATTEAPSAGSESRPEAASLVSSREASSSVPSQAKASSPVPCEAKASSPMPSQAEASSLVPSEAEASSLVPSRAEASSRAPSPPSEAASSGSGAPSSLSVAELPNNPQPMLNRSRVMATGASVAGSGKDGMSTWHVAGNCEKCFKPLESCNLLAIRCTFLSTC